MKVHDEASGVQPVEPEFETVYDDQDPRDVPKYHPPLHEPDEVPFKRHKDSGRTHV